MKMNLSHTTLYSVVYACFLLIAGQSLAQISYTTNGATITEDFDANLPSSAGNFTWTDDSVFDGWYAYQSGTSGAPAEYRRTSGNSSLAELFQWRAGSSASDGAFGTKPNDTVGDMLRGVRITNNTGNPLDSISVGYTGEQWYESGEVQNNQLVVAYQVGTISDLSAGSWTDINSLEFDAPQNGGNDQNLDGNLAANRQVFSPVNVSISGWDDGTDLWIRWFDNNNSGVDHGVAIDDFSFTAIPEPGTLLFMVTSLLAVVLFRRRSS